MSRPLYPKTIPARLRGTHAGVYDERRKPNLPGPYIYVSGGTGDVAPGETWQSVPWKNSFTQFGTSYVGFRHGLDGYTEFIGIIDLTAGAVTGTVAFTLPVEYRALTFNYTFPVFVEGTEWWAGILAIDKTTGDVTVYWPIKATAI